MNVRKPVLAASMLAGFAAIGSRAAEEPVRAIEMLANGRFVERVDSPAAAPEQRVAWWRSSGGELASGAKGTGVVLAPGQIASQPVAAYAPLARALAIRGRLSGRGALTVVDGSGARARFEPAPGEFAIGGADVAAAIGREPTPRLTIELSSVGDAASTWDELSVRVAFPSPDPAALRAEVRARLAEIVDTWLARGLDREGPRATGFGPHLFDACTGERLASYPCGLHPLFESLLELPASAREPAWSSALHAYVESVLELGLDATTGLPLLWDARADVPLRDVPLEIASMFRFLVDAAQRGPDDLRARCRAAAIRIGDAVLAHGTLPDGEIAPIYRPRDGAPSTDAQPLRRLDVPAQLCRLGALVGDERHHRAARSAVAAFAWLHRWPGELERIDPGFDDDFGHYGARAVAMTSAYPDDAVFRELALSGFRHFAPLWRDAARAGASMAADQVRCWDLLIELADHDGDVARELPSLLDVAVRAQLVGEQYGDGSWGDVTYWRFDPKQDLEVGDLPGTPANLLRGLALVHGRTSALSREDVRALYAAVLRSSVERYRRPYGYLATRAERAGANDAYGSMRLLPALVEMLAALDRP